MPGDHRTRKYILLVGDGMADYPLPELGGKSPLEAAHTPNMDRIAARRIGLVRAVPNGMEPGSDVANLSLLGYNPEVCHTGRAPFEAASMGIKLQPSEVAFRMNLVTLDRKSDNEILMVSHSAGNISTAEARQIVAGLKKEMNIPQVNIYPGVAYRHLLVWDDGLADVETLPPHDYLDRDMARYLSTAAQNPIPDLIRSSWDYLENHPVNVEREKKGLKPANSIWLWGQGKALEIALFNEKFGLRGGVISAVDLLKGIGICVGLEPIEVAGATGYLDTNYLGKAEGALNGLQDLDFMFVHVEAPDEASHNGNIREKIEAIEAFDEKVVGTVLEGLKDFEDYRIMVASDHFTPIVKRTHTAEPSPFAWAGKNELESAAEGRGFTEEFAGRSGLLFDKGYELMPVFLDRP
jgi:2,3-bisphosphoglycerate-independent phosphoglycerate mutase